MPCETPTRKVPKRSEVPAHARSEGPASWQSKSPTNSGEAVSKLRPPGWAGQQYDSKGRSGSQQSRYQTGLERAAELRELEVRLVQLEDIRDKDAAPVADAVSSACEAEFRAVWRCLARLIDKAAAAERVASAGVSTLLSPSRSTEASTAVGSAGQPGATGQSPCASPSPGASQDEFESLRSEQRRMRSRLGDLSAALDELRTQSGAALVSYARVRDHRDRDIACVLSSLQAQLGTLDATQLELAREVVKTSQHVSVLNAGSSDVAASQTSLNHRLSLVERGLEAVGLLDECGSLCLAALELQNGAGTATASATAAAASGGSSELESVRQRLFGLRAALSGGSVAARSLARPSPHVAASDMPVSEKPRPAGSASGEEAEAGELPRQAPKPLAVPVEVVTQPMLPSPQNLTRRSTKRDARQHEAESDAQADVGKLHLQSMKAEFQAYVDEGTAQLRAVETRVSAELAELGAQAVGEASARSELAMQKFQSQVEAHVEIAVADGVDALHRLRDESRKEISAELCDALESLRQSREFAERAGVGLCKADSEDDMDAALPEASFSTSNAGTDAVGDASEPCPEQACGDPAVMQPDESDRLSQLHAEIGELRWNVLAAQDDRGSDLNRLQHVEARLNQLDCLEAKLTQLAEEQRAAKLDKEPSREAATCSSASSAEGESPLPPARLYEELQQVRGEVTFTADRASGLQTELGRISGVVEQEHAGSLEQLRRRLARLEQVSSEGESRSGSPLARSVSNSRRNRRKSLFCLWPAGRPASTDQES